MSEQQFDPQEWLTSAEAAAMVGCTTRNITRAANAGTISAIRRGHMRFFLRDDILEYIQEIKVLGKSKHVPRIYREDKKDQPQ